MMKNFFSNYKLQIIILAIIGLFAMNYNIVVFGLNSDFFGILFSVLLFVFGSRQITLKVNYLLLAVIFILEFVSFRLHTKSLHFLSLLLLICLIFYEKTKKFSFIAFICILMFSSIFNKFFEHLTSEIKQGLCNLVFMTLKNFLHIDKIEGVNFFIKNSIITIDTACMGLSMFKTGLLIGAIILTFEETKQKKYFKIYQIIIFCILIILLNIISNYFRIVTLILFDCTQENLLHHSIGLVCFAFYQVLPMILVIKFLNPKIEVENHNETIDLSSFRLNEGFRWIVISIILIVIFFTSIEIKKIQNNDLLQGLSSEYNITNGAWITNEVYKIETPKKLIYIKTPSHKPMICWTGDGYLITNSKEITLNNNKVWFNKMEKNNIKYNSIWWYECGNKKYSSFIEVMFLKLIYNKPIRLINEVTRIK